MKNILVLCTGNICRSPTAHYLLQKQLGDDYEVTSAGLGALVDHAPDDLALKVAYDHDLDMSNHRAKQVTDELLRWADLVLVMEAGHKNELLSKYPWLDGKIFRYGDPVQVDIPDPYHRPESAFLMTWNFIAKFTPYWVERIKTTSINK